jgi:SAM-dependent methyltransferase
MDIRKYNQIAWDNKVKQGKRYTLPAGPETIKQAKAGNWQINLTPCIPVPQEWFPPVKGLKVLCLASGGGVQGPILAAAGADITVFDNSPLMLATDRSVAVRDSLKIRTVEGDMADLSQFSDYSFDLIVHPVSNTFVPDVLPVWKEAYRVLRKGGTLLSGFTNPAVYLFDWELAERTGELHVRYKLPYSDAADLDAAQHIRHPDRRTDCCRVCHRRFLPRQGRTGSARPIGQIHGDVYCYARGEIVRNALVSHTFT